MNREMTMKNQRKMMMTGTRNDNCCGKCKYHKNYTMGAESEWYCSNPDSYNDGVETEYNDTCEDFEEK